MGELKPFPVIETIPDTIVSLRLPTPTVEKIDIHAKAASRTRTSWIRHVIDNALMVQDERSEWIIGRKNGLWCITNNDGAYIYPRVNTIDSVWELRDEMNAQAGVK